MPRTVAEILDQADELAARFEAHEPDATDVSDAAALRAGPPRVPGPSRSRTQARRRSLVARAEGHSWAAIGAMVGTSGEAARQRYGRPISKA